MKSCPVPRGGVSVVMAANCVVSPPHLLLLPPVRREALTVAPVRLLGGVVLIRRRGGGPRLPAIVELWDVWWDVLWPAGPDRRAKAVSHGVITAPVSQPRCTLSLAQHNQCLGCWGTWGFSSCLPVSPTAASLHCWWSGRAAAGPPLSGVGGPQRVASLRGKDGPPAEGERNNSKSAETYVHQSSGTELTMARPLKRMWTKSEELGLDSTASS